MMNQELIVGMIMFAIEFQYLGGLSILAKSKALCVRRLSIG